MAVDPKKLIAAINPDLYCDPDSKGKVKAEFEATKDYLKAAEKAKLKDSEYTDVLNIAYENSALEKKGLSDPIEHHVLKHDEFSKSLEPLYFWLIDYMNGVYGKTQKLTDNFVASPGSGMHGEFGQKATRMQEEAMKMLGVANQVLRTILNLIYDLKEFKIRLHQYDDLKSEDPAKQNAAKLMLKQIWMDSVDIKRGNSSIKAMAQQYDYVTLIDAFMVADDLEKLTLPPEKGGIDLNDRVKRILQQRLSDFQLWLSNSESELRKRYEIEKNYLRSQVNSLKLYARWIKPYLKSAKQLEQSPHLENSSIVNLFNTAIFELSILGEGRYKLDDDIASGEIPPYFSKLNLQKYTPIVIVEMNFRSVPDRADQRGGYNFRGMVKVEFTSFALTDAELKVFKENIEKDDVGDVYRIIEDVTEKSLGVLKDDIEEFLEEKSKEEEEKKPEKKTEDANPFTALLSFLSSKKKEESKPADGEVKLKKDTSEEEVLRSQAILAARLSCRKLYDTFKKSMKLPAFSPTQD